MELLDALVPRISQEFCFLSQGESRLFQEPEIMPFAIRRGDFEYLLVWCLNDDLRFERVPLFLA